MLAYIISWLIKANHRDFFGMSCEGQRRDQAPFYMVILASLTALGMLGISLFWPYMIPFAITINQGAASHSSLVSTFLGASAFVFPLTAATSTPANVSIGSKTRSGPTVATRS